MGIKFKVHRTPQPKERKKGKLVHARAVSSGTVKMDNLCEMICARSTVSSADVKAVLDSFVWAISLSLESGQHVELEELGHFSPSLQTRPWKDGKRMMVTVDGVNFRCSKKLKEALMHTKLVRVKSAPKSTLEERKKRMMDYLETNEHITTPQYAELNSCSHYRASADLKAMAEKGEICRVGSKTHILYLLPDTQEGDEPAKPEDLNSIK